MKTRATFLLYVLVLLPFVSVTAQADSDEVRTFSFSALAGVNAAQLDGDGLGGYDKLGLHLGIGASFGLSERWSTGLELLYSQKGSQSELNPNATQQYIRLNYVEVPVYVSFAESDFRFIGGASYARLIDAEVDPFSPFAPGFFKDNDVCILFGMDYVFSERWRAHFRFTQSVLNSIRDEINADGLNSKHLTLRIGYVL